MSNMHAGTAEVPDHRILAVKCGVGENRANTLVYKDTLNRLCTIDLDACAMYYHRKHQTDDCKCIGDRDITGGYFLLYSGDTHTVIRFRRIFVFNAFGRKLLSGTRTSRFIQFQKLLSQAGYTTYDMS